MTNMACRAGNDAWRERLERRALQLEPVAQAAMGADGLGAQLLAQPAHDDLDRVAFGIAQAGAGQRLFDAATGADAARAARQAAEHGPLHRRQLDRLSAAAKPARAHVEQQFTRVQRLRPPAAAGHRIDARQQFIEIEGLDAVIARHRRAGPGPAAPGPTRWRGRPWHGDASARGVRRCRGVRSPRVPGRRRLREAGSPCAAPCVPCARGPIVASGVASGALPA